MNYFSFDVESVGLLGEPFAVGWVIANDLGVVSGEGYLACLPNVEDSNSDDVEWITQNVLPHLPEPNCEGLDEVCNRFWDEWEKAKTKYSAITMVCDVPFPVEANFLLVCAEYLQWSMDDSPYPILDVASILLAAGKDPLADYGRLKNEMPAHHPTSDARQSLRVMLSTLQLLKDQ